MALQTKYLQFNKSTGVGNQTVSGVGFFGKALLLWSTHQATSGATTGARISLGLTDGILQSIRSIDHPGGQASTTSAQAEWTTRIALMSNPSGTILVEGEFITFTNDGFVINWHVNDGEASIYHAIVLGGDIQAKFTQTKITCDINETLSVTGVGFQPTAFIVMGGAADEFGGGDYTQTTPYGSMHGFGFSNAVDNVCGWTLGLGGGVAYCHRGQHTNRVSSVRHANGSGAEELMGMRITSADADGYTITRDGGSTIWQPVQHVLCLRGVRFALGAFNAPTSPGGASITTAFRPDLLLLQSLGRTASDNAAGMDLAFGAWQRSTDNSGGVWIGGVDGANPSVYRRSTYVDSILETRDASDGTLDLQASVTATSDTGATLNFTSVSGTADQVLYMAIGPSGQVRGSHVFGEHGRIRGVSRAVLDSLDGNENELTESGVHKIAGILEVTGAVRIIDDALSTDKIDTIDLDSPVNGEILQFDGASWVNTPYIHRVGITIDGGGAPITTGVKGAIQVDFDGIIIGWSCVADQAGNLTVEVDKKASSSPPSAPAIPNTTTDKISASEPVILTSGQSAAVLASGVSTWTTTVSAWDVIQFNVAAIDTIQRVTMYLRIAETR